MDLPIPDLGDLISHVPDQLRMLIVLGLTLLLVILRFDAERFNAAEYDDIDRWGRPPSLLRRLAWYLLGIGGVFAVAWMHPDPANGLFLTLGDRVGTLLLGLTYGAIGVGIAVGIALIRYGYVRFPPVASCPGKFINAIATAFVAQAWIPGILFPVLVSASTNPNLATLIQALLYALATRLGEPGRPWYMLASMFAIGLAGGWLTGITGGIGAAFLGPAITRIAIFLTTGHAGIPKPRGTEDEEVARRRATPQGRHVIDPRDGDR